MKQAFATTPMRAAVLTLTVVLGACSSLDGALSGDKIDYRNGARKTSTLEVPPDLTPLTRDGRYLPQAGAVSANAMQQRQQQATSTPAAADAPVLVAPQQVGDVRVVREGNTRWLVTSLPPEKLFPKLRQFWMDQGFALAIDSPETGLLETEWAENRAKLPDDFIRNTIGKVFDQLYSTGERDKFRTRIERSAAGTEIYISHRGMEEVYTDRNRDDRTTWTGRAADPQLEAVFLSRLMVSLGSADAAAARVAVASATSASSPVSATSAAAEPKARALTDQAGATLRVDDNAERAWRRVGLALDRSGFTVEDRDRAQRLYFVRYADPKTAGKEEPSFFTRLFSSKETLAQLSRYRIAVKADGASTLVSVQNDKGEPDNSANAQQIVKLLVEELKY